MVPSWTWFNWVYLVCLISYNVVLPSDIDSDLVNSYVEPPQRNVEKVTIKTSVIDKNDGFWLAFSYKAPGCVNNIRSNRFDDFAERWAAAITSFLVVQNVRFRMIP